ncbi:hypothetical protein O1C72_003452 [Vibrio cholerae]|nr:hypothetical protein [Vibrio cholerae]
MNYSPREIGQKRILIEGVLLACLMVSLVFLDVIFNSGSLRITDQIFGYKISSLIELPRTTGWWGGYHDNGGASFQSEPMMEFMKNTLSSGQSPYWNPYSSAGAVGPETLVDQKFSLFTICYAILGGGSIVYNFLSVSLYFFSLFFTYLTLRGVFKLSIISAVAGCVFYLLNGYSVANISSNIIQSYLYIPMCVYFSLLYFDKVTSIRIVSVIISFSVLLSCTFIPTTITSFLAIYTVLIGYLLLLLEKQRFSITFIFDKTYKHVGLVVCSVLLMSFLYFPIFENIIGLGTVSDYSKRIYFPLYFPQALASFYSPSHFFESYNSMESRALYWLGSRSFNGNAVFHFGIIGITLIGFSLFHNVQRFKGFSGFCAAIVFLVLLRLFDFSFISSFVSTIPVLGTLGAHYWWPAVIVPTTFLVAIGVENLKNGEARVWPALIFLLIGVFGFLYVYRFYGLTELNVSFKVISLSIICFLFLLSFLLLFYQGVNKLTHYRNKVAVVVVLFMFMELFYSSKMLRMQRNDYFISPHGEISYLKEHTKLYRTMNFGQTGLRPELGAAFQIQEITSMNQGVLPNFLKYYYASVELDIPQRFGYHVEMMPNGAFPTTLLVKDDPSSNRIDLDKISLLGVKYIIIPAHYKKYALFFENNDFFRVYDSPTAYIFENKNVYSRAFSIPIENVDKDFKLDTSIRRSLIPANIEVYENTNVSISGYTNTDSLVVLTDNYHENWSATLNGESTKIHVVDGVFRGIFVPKGKFVINMSYEPKTLFAAKVTSFTLVAILLILIFFRRKIDRFFDCSKVDLHNV